MNRIYKWSGQLAMVFVVVCFVSSCGPRDSSERFVLQKIPITIQNGKSVSVDVYSLSGNGPNDVGIRCLPEVWNVLTNSREIIQVRLKSSGRQSTRIYSVAPGGAGAGFIGYIPNVYYLFEIAGERNVKASIEIVFPHALAEAVHAEIIVCKTPADTEADSLLP